MHNLRVDGNLIYIEFGHELTRDDLAELAVKTDALEQSLGRSPDRIVDMTLVETTDIDYKSILALAQARAQRTMRDRYRMILVARTPVGFGLARMYDCRGARDSYRTSQQQIATERGGIDVNQAVRACAQSVCKFHGQK